MKCKRFCRNFLLLILTLSILTVPSYAGKARTIDDTTPCNWYCKHVKNGESPQIPSEFSFILDYDGVFWDDKTSENEKVIYLTFDAGYVNENVETILNVLEKHGATGAFFILDHVIIDSPDLVRQMVNSGNLVCNHTLKHKDMTKVSTIEDFSSELKALEDLFRECTGQEMPKFYRPPEGKFSRQNMQFAKELGYHTVFWSFAYADWDNNHQMSPDKALQKILDATHNGEIILLHPTSATNAAIMDQLLTAWEEQGYRFGTLTELAQK